MNRFLLILAVCLSSQLMAQPLQPVFEQAYEPQFFDYFLSSGQKNHYLSPDGQRMLITSDLRYSLIDANQGDILAEGTHLAKSNAGINQLFAFMKQGSFNREDAMERARFDEGTEYLVLPEADLVLMLDWNVSDNVVKAIDLHTGEVKWTVDRYRYSSSSRSQFVDLILGVANAGRLQRETPQDLAVKSTRLQGFGAQAYRSEVASPAARGFLTPLTGTGLCLLKVHDRYVALDLETGAERWVYDQRVLNFGFAEMSDDGALVVVNFNSSYWQANERLILKLDPLTGEEIWTAQHLSNFREGRTYLMGDRLICDYYGAEVFDLETGERLLLSIDERTVKTQNTVTAMFNASASGGRGTEAIASPSQVYGDFLYTSTFRLGGRTYANDGSSKALVQQYSLRSGEQLWESDKLSVGTDLSYANATHVFVRKGKALGKSQLYVLDAKTGEELAETETIDGFIYRAGAVDVLADGFLFRGGKKDVYAFSTQDWDLTQTYDVKDAKVGRLQAIMPAGSAMMALGDKGLALFDGRGQAQQVIQTDRIEGSFWNEAYGFLFTDRGTLAVDLVQHQPAGSLNLSPSEQALFLFSADGSRLAIIEGGHTLRVFANERAR
jgi:outer membrane protein assembly factor BamB